MQTVNQIGDLFVKARFATNFINTLTMCPA